MMMARRRILIAAGTIAMLTIVVPPWQNSFYNDSFIGWRPLLRPPTERVRMIDDEVRAGRMPVSALEDPKTVADTRAASSRPLLLSLGMCWSRNGSCC